MSPWRAALLTCVIVPMVVLVAAPAQAQQASVEDAAGDAENNGPDITKVTLDNRDRATMARVEFVEAVRGDLIVSIDRRRDWGLRLVSQYRPGGDTESFVLPGAFTDGSGSGAPDAIACPRFRVRWNDDTDVARMKMPSSCLDDGNYGAVRFIALTERNADSDFAPEEGSSPFIPRG